MTGPWLSDPDVTLYHGDAIEVLRILPEGSVDCVVTSPPYWGLRDYGVDGQVGLEETPDLYVQRIVEVFREVRRVLAPHGTCWINLGDSYATTPTGNRGTTSALHGAQSSERYQDTLDRYTEAKQSRAAIPDGLKPKDLVGIPWRVAFALQADGWWLRSDVIWSKPNPMPESVKDRPTKSHEYVFLLTKSASYFYDADAIKEPHESVRWGGRYHKDNPLEKYRNIDASRIAGGSKLRPDREEWDHYPDGGKNARSVWHISTQPYEGAHFATFPEELVRRCVLAGSPEGGVVLDPFVGSGTTCFVARNHQRRSIGIDINGEYLRLAAHRLQQLSLLT